MTLDLDCPPTGNHQNPNKLTSSTPPAITPRPIIIDTDPGQDDALAILAAIAAPELKILGITAVAGNVPLDLTANNALKICELAGRPDIPVFAGRDRPLRRDLITAEQVHGTTGIDGADLPEPTTSLQPQNAVDWITEQLTKANEQEITICPVGPMSNIATVLEAYPTLSSKIREIVCMGGGFFVGGNTTPTAEFNVLVDPEAAQIVLHSGAPVTMLPLDVTHKALMAHHWISKVRTLGTHCGIAAANMLEFYERFDMEKYGTSGGPLHDPNVIAYLLHPEMYKGRYCNVEIETISPLTTGMTVVDWWGVTDRPVNCYYITEVDADGFYNLLLELLARLP
ncbi:MAG: nucleoside hydrolase [Acidimicrobiia bacterium]|nr:nucleoside hydrolase [Acidimicrobiia bacterium]